MDFAELIKKRYSVRAYKDKHVEQHKLQQVLTAAQLAPTACNRQPFRLVVLNTKGREADLKRVYPQDWLSSAPLVICACAVPSEGWVRRFDGKNYTEVDVTIAMDHLILAAADLGLGTCWIAAFDPAAARVVFDLPTGTEPVALTPLGYPADSPREKTRKPLEEIVTYLE